MGSGTPKHGRSIPLSGQLHDGSLYAAAIPMRGFTGILTCNKLLLTVNQGILNGVEMHKKPEVGDDGSPSLGISVLFVEFSFEGVALAVT